MLPSTGEDDDLIRQGLSLDAARKEAERQFGDLRSVERIGQQIGQKNERRRRVGDYWNDLLHDVRYSSARFAVTLAPPPSLF